MNIKLTTALLALASVAGGDVALADLKPAAPKAVNLTAIWKINAELSEDPQQVLAKRRDESSGRGSNRSMPRGGTGTGTGGIDAGDILAGTISGSISRGRGARNSGSDRPDEDPEPQSSTRMPLDSFLATREQFEIEQRPDALTVRTIDETSTCKPSQTGQVRMPNGDLLEQRCGWDGSAFVTELKSPDGVTRVTRYELRKSDQQLVLTNQIKGGRGQMRGLQIRRVYDRLVAF